MKFSQTALHGTWMIALEKRADERGFFARTWCAQEMREQGLDPVVAQINTGVSTRAGTLRGLHFQEAPHAEAKIARCVRGAAFDVAVDLRPDSPTFLRWFGAVLTAENGHALYVPGGCAHGYLTLEDDTELTYTTSKPYAPKASRGVRYDDAAFGIRWPRTVEVVSDADRSWPDYKRSTA